MSIRNSYNPTENTFTFWDGLAEEERVIHNLHPKEKCKGTNCIIHNPSHNFLSHLPLHWREDAGKFERICEHGVGHTDIDHPGDGVHGCCGCCTKLCKEFNSARKSR